MTVIKILVRVATVLVFLAMLVATVWFATQGVAIGIVSCAMLALGFGYFVYRDIRALLAKKLPPPAPGG